MKLERDCTLPKCPKFLHTASINQAEIIATLKASEKELRAQGVRRVALFGSFARGTECDASDIDIAVEVDPGLITTMFAYANLKDKVASLFQGPVDVVDFAAMKPRVRQRVAVEAVYAF